MRKIHIPADHGMRSNLSSHQKMPFEVHFKPLAEKDLVDAINYLESQRKGLGFELFKEVNTVIAIIKQI